MNIRIKTTVPGELLKHLEKCNGHYTEMRDLFHCIQLGEKTWVGVAGDGANGSYEHFRLEADSFECSDGGYGDTAIALREALNAYLK